VETRHSSRRRAIVSLNDLVGAGKGSGSGSALRPSTATSCRCGSACRPSAWRARRQRASRLWTASAPNRTRCRRLCLNIAAWSPAVRASQLAAVLEQASQGAGNGDGEGRDFSLLPARQSRRVPRLQTLSNDTRPLRTIASCLAAATAGRGRNSGPVHNGPALGGQPGLRNFSTKISTGSAPECEWASLASPGTWRKSP